MRLIKVQKALFDKCISYNYKEINGCGMIDFISNGKFYTISEKKGKLGYATNVTETYTNIAGLGKYGNQNKIVEAIEKGVDFQCNL